MPLAAFAEGNRDDDRVRSNLEYQMGMAPDARSHQMLWCYGTLSKLSIGQRRREVQLLMGRFFCIFSEESGDARFARGEGVLPYI